MNNNPVFTEKDFLNTIKSFENIKDLDNEIHNLQKRYINIKNFKDREFIKFMYLKYAFLFFYTKNKNRDIISDFNKGDKNYYLSEFIGIINMLKEKNKSVVDYYSENDKDSIIKIEENCFFNNCETDTIEILEDNKDVYTFEDLKDIFNQKDNKNIDITDNLIKLLNTKYDNTDILNEQLTSIINSKIIIPITDEFMVVNNNNIISEKVQQQNDKNKSQTFDFSNLFFNHMNKQDHKEDLLVNQNEILKSIYNNESRIKSGNSENIKKVNALKQYFESSYLNYLNNVNFLNYSNHSNNFVSVRKSKLNNTKLMFRECLKDQNIILSGFCLFSDKDLNYKDNKITLEETKKILNDAFLKSKIIFETEYKKFVLDQKKLQYRYYYFFDKEDPTSDILELHNFIFNQIKNKKITSLFPVFNYSPEWFAESNPLNGKSKLIKYSEKIETDKNELIMYGMNENKIKLPDYEISTENKTNEEIEKINSFKNAVCQHIIDKRELEDLKLKKNFSLFETKSYEYVKKYVVFDFNGNKICKSCSEKIDVSGIITDDSAASDFSNTSISYKNLDKLSEYSKYGKTENSDGLINNVDLIISDLGNILNLKSYSGSSNQQINIRKKIIKDIIDIITNLRKTLTENKDIKTVIPDIIKKYNINNTANNDFYIFSLSNSIYETTKQDVYQNKKRNNIIYYILFIFLLNLNEQMLIDTLNKKILLIKGSNNIYVDYKNHKEIFNGIKILVKNQKVDIKNYDVLCFCLYLFSRILSQEKYKNKIILDVEYKQISIQAQIIIIFSCITLLNTVLECTHIVLSNKANYSNSEIQLCDNLQSRFNNQIDIFFNKTEILTSYFNKDVKTEDNKKDRKILNFEDLDKIKDLKYLKGEKAKEDKKNFMDGGLTVSYNNYNTINQDLQQYNYSDFNIQNNADIFHDFTFDSKINTMKCKNCGILFKDFIKSKNKKPVSDLVFLQYMKNRIKNYCPNGSVHDMDLKTNTCKKCKYKEGTIYSEDQLVQLYKNLSKGIIIKDDKIISFTTHQEQNKDKTSRRQNLELNKELLKKLSDIIINVFGDYFSLENKNIYINKNIYRLDFSYNNSIYQPPKVFIPETGKLDKKRVYKYIDSDLIVYYDYHTLQPIAYQNGKSLSYLNFENLKNSQNLIIEYSIIDMIQNLFNKQKFIIFNTKKEIKNYISVFYDSVKNFKIMFIRYFNKIINGMVYKKEKEIQDLNQLLKINELYFDIKPYYGKFSVDKSFKPFNSVYETKQINEMDLKEIEIKKVYETKRINTLIKPINDIQTTFYSDLLKIAQNINNKLFYEFLLLFIYHYFIENTDFYKNNNQQIIMFNNVIKSQNVIISDRTKINFETLKESLIEDNEKLKEKLNDNALDDKEYEEKVRKKEEEQDEREGYDIDRDEENEDDYEYEDNDK